MRWTIWCGLLGVVTFGSACGIEPLPNPSTLRDAAGYEFEWRCDDNGCRVPSTGDAPDEQCEDGRFKISYSWGRFVSLCGVCTLDSNPHASWRTQDRSCRLVACDTTDDCPQIYEYQHDRYECVRGLCQSTDTAAHPRDEIAVIDARGLCYADQPRLPDGPEGDAQDGRVRAQYEPSCPALGEGRVCHSPLPEACLEP